MTDTRTTSGGVPIPSQSIVSADQVTIIGDGTTQNPLHAAVTGPLFSAQYMLVDNAISPTPGLPVIVNATPPTFGVASVTSGNSNSTEENAQVIAVIVRLDGAHPPDGVVLRGAGPVILLPEQWDIVTGLTGGLTPSAEYYLGPTGYLTETPPQTPGTFLSRVGIALSASTLLLSLPSDPISN